jgi:CheY-like chemotaxis protein
MKETSELLDALAHVAWPALVGVVLWRLLPVLAEVIRSRGFAIKVGGFELSAQEATDQLRSKLAELQARIEELRPGADSRGASAAAAPAGSRAPRRILWVDDRPENNALEIAQLRETGVEVVTATSTAQGLEQLLRRHLPVAAVITDMGRVEGGSYDPRAGLALTEQVRAAGISVPVFVYTSSRGLRTTRTEAQRAGAEGATASSFELFEFLRRVLPAES